jgi:hypothetical protein
MLHSAFTAIIWRRFRAGQAGVAMENSDHPCKDADLDDEQPKVFDARAHCVRKRGTCHRADVRDQSGIGPSL